ncbi:AraC-like DNA-binding protein [Leeuwenhoekiella aestuarii]|uniref:helix-turn-helix domain-containing protein n=1 Tax=Leeuwenhoekiella aestuarii TaxID=2249426 RepID=UPI000FFE9438|nr:AraC family transcriptional regulator [Leeuwenhoekiella aestuarii]RXG17130.1 AraC-like DNA-binding protein [Leeuwenhoekiella aestuarii]
MERSKKERFNQLFNQIKEIAVGNFEFRYKPSARLDAIDTFGALLNMLSEEIAYFNFDSSGEFMVKPVPVVVVFNDQSKLIDHSACFLRILGYSDPQTEITRMDSYLTDYSIPLLTEELQNLTKDPDPKPFPLDFNTSDKRIFRSNCSLLRLIKQDKPVYVLLIYEDFKKDNLKPNPEVTSKMSKSVKKRSATNRVLAKKLRMYCLRNLNKPLPSLREIGLIHETNATKIKTVFKKTFGVTIYQYHLQKRLSLAYAMLEESDYSIKYIANKNGFNSASHFTRSFKKHYGKAPLFFRKD